MVFSSATFLFIFLPLFLAAYYLIDDRYRNILIFWISVFFYAWGEPRNVIWLLITVEINYFAGIMIERCKERGQKHLLRTVEVCAVIYDLGLLFFFKYYNFAVFNINRLFSTGLAVKDVVLPIGISFYIFKCMSYIFDVASDRIKCESKIIDFGTYIAFFPQLMAGPITRYGDVRPYLSRKNISTDTFYRGIVRFMTGFSKKVLLSDQLTKTVSTVFSNDGFSAPAAWLGAVAFTLEIYFDFSGYSDMAIGLGLMLGLETKENFNFPYASTSIQDFWRRWHISLSTWFRDYIYFPLGGSRCSKARVVLNTTIVFLLTGLWHGASWNFVAWGLFYVIFLIAERFGFKGILSRLPRFFQYFYSWIIIVVGWVFFRADGFRTAVRYLRNMFVVNPDSLPDLIRVLDKEVIVCMFFGILLSSRLGERIHERMAVTDRAWIYDIFITILFFVAICYMWGGGFRPFLYFQF